jgi:tetratricopeptide (TPR) repeat protein
MTGKGKKRKQRAIGKKDNRGKRSDNSGRSAASISPGQNRSVDSILQKAARLYYGKKLKEVIELLTCPDKVGDGLGDNAPFENDSQKIKYYRLLSFAYANGEEYANAEVAAMKGMKLDENDRDLHFALAFVYSNYQDYDRCLQHAERFTELFDDDDTDELQKGWLSYGHRHLIYNFIGLAHKAQNNLKQAEKAFYKAIELHPSYDHPYINLTNFYIHCGEHDKAAELVNLGLKKCSQVQELRMLKNILENKATVSACMIVKNEEEMLPACLDSIRSWVDEIIIVDTGSTDRTVEIARSYGAKLYFQEWEGDFSKPRNLSLSKATCDWIFVIDADEEFVGDTLPKLRQALNQDKYRIISIDVHNLNLETGIVSSFLPSNRFFKRDAEFYYDGIVHNQLIYEKNELILRADVVLKHYGYDFSREKMASKLARSRELLEKQLKERPDDPFVHFNYAQILRSFSLDPDEQLCNLIMKHACRAAELSDTDPGGTLHTHLQALHQQITTFIQLKKYQQAIEVSRRALELKPDFLDALYSMAEAYARIPDYANGEKYFLEYLEEQEKYSTVDDKLAMIQLFAFGRHRAYYWLGLINQYCKRPEKAEEYFLKTLDEQEPFADTYLGLINIYLDRQDLKRANTYIDKELECNPDSGICHFYKARYYGLKNNDQKAAEFMEKAVELDDDNDEILQRAGIYWANKGQVEKALPLFEKLVKLKADNPNNLKLLSKAYYDTGNFKDSSAWYKRYLELNPNDADAIHDMANCFFKHGDYENAEKHYARALEINGNLAAVYRNLGLTKIHLGKQKEALALLDVYVGIAPGDLEIEFAIGSLMGQLGDFSAAIPHFEKYLAGNPTGIDGLFGISECYFNLGHTGSAAIGYMQILKLNTNYQPARRRLEEIEKSETVA